MSEIHDAQGMRKGETSAAIGFGEPTRLLYFGSRSWIDVQPGLSIEDAKRQLRVGRVYKGPRYRAVHAQMSADVARFDGWIEVIEGEADGADRLARKVASELLQGVRMFLVDHAKDGPWPAAGHRRNARMYREGQPREGRCFASGRIGEPLSRGSAGMLSILQRAGCSVVVWREDGIEIGALVRP